MEAKKYEIKKICRDNYDRFWKVELDNSPKATSYKTYKNNINFESYLQHFKKFKLRIGLSRFRLSNHNLMIEKGRHFKPKLERNERKCYVCKNQIENEEHFLLNCPLFTPQRKGLEIICKENCERYDNLTQEQKFIFIMSNEDPKVINALGKFVANCSLLREKFIETFTERILMILVPFKSPHQLQNDTKTFRYIKMSLQKSLEFCNFISTYHKSHRCG